MKPNRPDSAKSAKTRITIDSEISSNNLNASKFSETFSNGVNPNHDKNNDFHKYVAEKNKDPKFKKFLQTNLPEIPQQLKPSAELTKLTSKPFQRKQSKVQKQKSQRKVEQPPKRALEESKNGKKEALQNSKTFIDKSKQKLKVSSKQQIQQKQGNIKMEQSLQIQNDAKQNLNTNKPKINLNGFVLNIPGKAPKIIKQQKIQQKKQQTKEQKQKRQRQKLMTELSQYVQQMEQKNVQYLPKRYDEFIQRNLGNKDVDLQKIVIDDFLDDPNEKDYDILMKKINQNELQLQRNDQKGGKLANKSNISLNLEEIIDGTGSEADQNAMQTSSVMSSMTASDVRDRNLFITDILKGRRLTQDQLSQIQQNDNTMLKLIKLQGINRQQQLEDDIQMIEINMSKKKTNKFVERNKYEAGGELYRECDFLTPEQQQRIQDLINGAVIESPFQMTELEALMNRRIDEGIKLHRQLCQSIQGGNQQSQAILIIDEQTLPKDPLLRKNAQIKILKDKINSINSRLATVNEVVINKAKIMSLINKYKDTIKPSKMSQSLIQEKQSQIDEQCKQLKQAQNMLNKIEQEKDEILKLVSELTENYRTMEADILRIQNMDAQQLKKMEQQQLKKKKKKIELVQSQAKQFESDLEKILEVGEDLKKKMQILDQIMSVKSDQMKCDGHQQNETIQDIDALITRKWQAAEDAIRDIRQQHQ